MSNNRRDFLKKGALLGLSGIAGSLIGKNKINQIQNVSEQISLQTTVFTLPPLPYAFEALEPFIDRQTMELHHDKHHKAYVDKLNSANLSSLDLQVTDDKKCMSITNASLPILRNNLGGHYNHSLFWELLKPNPQSVANAPTGKLAESIQTNFKSFEDFKKEFSDKALKIFGSGWCWLIIDESGKLKITTTANQDNPLMQAVNDKGKPVLALDVWEHAYYLKYQNKRADYIAAWWNIINWQKAEELFNSR